MSARRSTAVAAVVVACVVLLAGCISEGTVVDKDVKCVGTPVVCHRFLYLENERGETGRVGVSIFEYRQIEVGDYYRDDS